MEKFTPAFTGFSSNPTQCEYSKSGNIVTIRLSFAGTKTKTRFHRLPSYPYGHPLYYMNPKQRIFSRLTYKTPKKTKRKPKSKPELRICLPWNKTIKAQSVVLSNIKYKIE